MKKYIVDTFIGLIFGIIFIFSPGIITGNGGLIGAELFSKFFPDGILGLLLLGVPYILTGSLLYLLINKFFKPSGQKNVIFQSLYFALGEIISYAIFFIVAILVLSRGQIGLL